MTDTTSVEETQPASATGASDGARQSEMPFAMVDGKPMTSMPMDLYIPPDALEVFLEAFEGPLDLLLYLIKRQNLDILDIKVAEITRQYMDYIGLMTGTQFELAAEYLVMAAVLAEIKSRMLLPRQVDAEAEEDDPRAELIRRLQEYERFKQAAMDVDGLKRMHRDFWVASADVPMVEREKAQPEVDLREMLLALAKVLKRAENFTSHRIAPETLSTRERMSAILDQVQQAGDQFVAFSALFDAEEGRGGVVVTFLAVMELIKESLLEIVQTEAFAPIHVKTRTLSEGAFVDEQMFGEQMVDEQVNDEPLGSRIDDMLRD
ncbi:MAG: segregation and condensation protein A [Candidatus Pseudothioglobus sp.]|jgi:segregation and condensation protein A